MNIKLNEIEKGSVIEYLKPGEFGIHIGVVSDIRNTSTERFFVVDGFNVSEKFMAGVIKEKPRCKCVLCGKIVPSNYQYCDDCAADPKNGITK